MPGHSEVLDLLFTFMYPEGQPNLNNGCNDFHCYHSRMYRLLARRPYME